MSRRRTYAITVSHSGLNKHRVLTGTDSHLLQRKAELLSAEWNAKWQQKLERDEARQEKQQLDEERRAQAEEKRLQKQQVEEARQAKSQQALQATSDAQAALETLGGILAHTLSVVDTVEWDGLKDTSTFTKPAPSRLPPSREPTPTDTKYRPKLNVVDQLSASRRQKKVDQAKEEFERDHKAWEDQQSAADQAYDEAQKQWDQ